MPSPAQLEIAANGTMAVLGAWLGLTVLTRSASRAGRLFALLALALAAWAVAVTVESLAPDPAVSRWGRRVAEFALALAIPSVALISLAIASGTLGPGRRRAVALAYAVNVLVALPAIVDPAHPIRMRPPHFVLPPVPTELLYAAWVATRFGTLLLTALWVLRALLREGRDRVRTRQLQGLLATVAAATVGGSFRILPGLGDSDPWIGNSIVTFGLLLAAWTVFSTGVFLAPAEASRAFVETLAAGAGVAAVAGGLVAVDLVSRRALGIDLPLLTVVALVAVIALYEPVTAWMRGRLGQRTRRQAARRRLLGAMGLAPLSAQPAEAGVRPALERLTRALDLSGAAVVATDGRVLASEGGAAPPRRASASAGPGPDRLDGRREPGSPAGGPPADGAAPGHAGHPVSGVPLIVDGDLLGELRVMGTRSGRPLAGRDQELLRLSARYVAAALRAGRLEDQQLDALDALSVERASLDASASVLDTALLRRAGAPPGLHVLALGPLRVERGDVPIERWGGEKAGSRQALALFAFLLDRGERGVAKDEALELVWPDADLEHADLAFHRTLRGLRSTLDPGGGGRTTIRFGHDRYRLDPAIVAWTDVAAFLDRLDEASRVQDPATALRLLEAARALYRGDYLDDCPIYGDSAFVEERRSALRARYVDLLTAIGEASEARADRVAAAAAYRDALAAAVDGCGRAEAGLARLATAG